MSLMTLHASEFLFSFMTRKAVKVEMCDPGTEAAFVLCCVCRPDYGFCQLIHQRSFSSCT